MTQAYQKPSILLYRVAVENDGCFRAWVDNPCAYGSIAECAQFIANHLPPRGYEGLAIYPTGEGRRPSYILPPPTYRRRIRLLVQDLVAD